MTAENIGTSVALVTVSEAAKILGTTCRRIQQWLRAGTLQRVTDRGFHSRLYAAEVHAFAESRKEPISISQLHRALLAERYIRTGLERRLDRLERVLLLRPPVIGNNEAEIVALVERACYAAKKPPTEVLAVLDWCSLFFGVQEETLHLVELHTDNPEPWAPFLTLAEEMYKNCGLRLHDQDIKDAYVELAAARRALRQTAFFYITQSRGEEYAQRVVPEAATDVIRKINSHVR